MPRVQGTAAATSANSPTFSVIRSRWHLAPSCTETYMVAGRLRYQEEAEYAATYLRSFVRFLVSDAR